MSAESGSPVREGDPALPQEPMPAGLEIQREQLSVQRADLYRKLDSARQALEAFREALAAATGGPLADSPGRESSPVEPGVERLLSAVRALDEVRSLSGVLSTLVERAGQEAPRTALFLLKDGALHGWQATGFPLDVSSLRIAIEAERLLQEAVRRGEAVRSTDDGALVPPAFAALQASAPALAVPLLVGSLPVAILYADEGGGSPRKTSSAWGEAIQILSRHASSNLAHLTAARTADVLRYWLAPGSVSAAPPGGSA